MFFIDATYEQSLSIIEENQVGIFMDNPVFNSD